MGEWYYVCNVFPNINLDLEVNVIVNQSGDKWELGKQSILSVGIFPQAIELTYILSGFCCPILKMYYAFFVALVNTEQSGIFHPASWISCMFFNCIYNYENLHSSQMGSVFE